MQLEHNITINASPERAFDYLTDVRNRKDYIPALEDVLFIDPPPIRRGSRYIEVSTIAGRRLETTYQVIAFEQNRRISAKTLKSIFPIQADLNLRPDEDSTQLTLSLQFQLSGIFKLASGIVRGIVNQQAKEILKKLKTNIERVN